MLRSVKGVKCEFHQTPYHHSRITYFGPSLSLNVPVERVFTCSRDLKRPRSSKAKQLHPQVTSSIPTYRTDCQYPLVTGSYLQQPYAWKSSNP